jgi:hypothetical protein
MLITTAMSSRGTDLCAKQNQHYPRSGSMGLLNMVSFFMSEMVIDCIDNYAYHEADKDIEPIFRIITE